MDSRRAGYKLKLDRHFAFKVSLLTIFCALPSLVTLPRPAGTHKQPETIHFSLRAVLAIDVVNLIYSLIFARLDRILITIINSSSWFTILTGRCLCDGCHR